MARYVNILFFLLCFPLVIHPQHQNIQFTHLTTKDGLSNNRVNAILKDSKGFMWFGTDDGLNRYDGYTFKVYKYDPTDSTTISGNMIASICEDRFGDIWIGTKMGAFNRFNRTTGEFSRFAFMTQDSVLHSDLWVNHISEDPSDSMQVLWMGHRWGLAKYVDDPASKVEGTMISTFSEQRIIDKALPDSLYKYIWKIKGGSGFYIQYWPLPHYQSSMSAVPWKNIIQDKDGNLWFGTSLGLNKFDTKTEISTRYIHDPKDTNGISSNLVLGVYIDNDGCLWAGTNGGGLNKLDIKNEKFYYYRHDPDNPYSIGSDYVHHVYGDEKNNIWVLTGGGGFYRFDRKTGTFECIKRGSSRYSRIGLSYYGTACLDNTGNHWIATADDGIYMYSPQKDNIRTHILYTDVGMTTDARAFYKDKYDILWVSTAEGLYKFDTKTYQYTFNKYYREHTNPLYQHSITAFHEGKYGGLWLGTEEGGLKRYDMNSGETIQFYLKPLKKKQKYFNWINHIRKLVEGPDDTIILINYVSDIIVFNIKTQDYYYLPIGGTVFLMDTQKIIWIGSWNVHAYNSIEETDSCLIHSQNHTNVIPLSNNRINTIFEDRRQNLWSGTTKGLHLLLRESSGFKSYTVEDGLVSAQILSILDDDHENLWLCTLNGISKFNYYPADSVNRPLIKNYVVGDQIQFYADEICYKDDDGFMYFGGKNGFVSFHPDSITENLHMPPIVFTDFKLFNRSVEMDSVNNFLLKSDISETDEIVLSYDQNFFSLEFAALDYMDPMRNQYAYKMDGIDRNWIYTDAGHRQANYTNVDPGEYTFHVKGSNNDGFWNEAGTSLRVIITPPWWRTNWAYSVYTLIVLLTLYTLRFYDRKRQRLKHELALEHEHAEKLQEIDHMKSRFFANISHEFRTPLTLILGPIHSLITRIQDQVARDELSLMQRNARRLQRLINQLLDLSKLESGGMILQLKKENMIDLVRNYIQSFESLAKQKNIKYTFNFENDSISAFVDRDKIEKILNNLLSNAFKFTPEGGEIEVRLGTNNREHPPQSPLNRGDVTVSPLEKGDKGGCIKIAITDTGIGIPPDRIGKIFNRFYQVDGSHTREHEGTGIGLALTKELVELHQGNITVDSTPGKGTEFTVSLPLGKEPFKEDEIFKERLLQPTSDLEHRESSIPDEKASILSAHRDQIIHDSTSIENPESSIQHPVSSILIVEDNADMRTYIQEHLSSEYKIIEAKNGEEGFQKATKKIPDLIISDIMMPVMDGYRLCEKLKTDQRTSHIPVILLTARAAKEDKLEGLETGADDYINKPFDADELQVRIKNLIEQRRKLKERFCSEALFPAAEIVHSSTDQQLLDKTLKIIEQNLDNPEFTINILSAQIGMSREHLTRKVKALTNQSPHMFIRLMRLKRAAILLKNNAGNVTEVAYGVGFKNLSHFAKSFREQFGITPSKFSSLNS